MTARCHGDAAEWGRTAASRRPASVSVGKGRYGGGGGGSVGVGVGVDDQGMRERARGRACVGARTSAPSGGGGGRGWPTGAGRGGWRGHRTPRRRHAAGHGPSSRRLAGMNSSVRGHLSPLRGCACTCGGADGADNSYAPPEVYNNGRLYLCPGAAMRRGRRD
jgi:hypothetical protein